MRKIFFLTALLMMILTATAFAEEPAEEPTAEPESDETYVYTSEYFKYSILCPKKPVAVVRNPWEEPEKRGEMLVFDNEGFDILYAFIIQVDAFDTNKVPDFNKGTMIAIGDYLLGLKKNGGFAVADLVDITRNNKGVYAVTADKIEVLNNETHEVEGEFVADRQYAYTFFRTPEGRCISVQLISANLEDKIYIDAYRAGVASFKDLSADSQSDKAKKKKEKRKKKNK